MKNQDRGLAKAAGDRKWAFFPPEMAVMLRVAVFCAAAGLTACGAPTPTRLNQELMTATTSPIPGATATVLPAPAGAASPAGAAASNAPASHFCVTDAGYCPLAAAVPAGQNCLCETGSLKYGGTTNAAPVTYQPPMFSPAAQ
jgi:hypothetical protein